ncbi:hypothetical protein Cgig2_009648 [Carnegiea gigantea]|uniref:Reverse transcriptase domain-containing protein n=1 Tax=Carnegiea gigantea TaxID=171969 RepID=A0A9Q1K2D6_9CARY|nr:hypothetical protein Cgig2_009648 [Carnegiea gigantea]
MEVRGHPMLRRPPPMTAPPRPQSDQKYCEFHEQSGHTTTECRELKKAIHELADKGQIDRFLKRGPRFLRQEQSPAPPPPRDEKYSTEVVATIAGSYVEEITRTAWKAQLRSAQQICLRPLTTSLILRDESLQPPALCNGLYPLAKTLAMAISFSETFGGSEAPGAARSQDLTISWTRESLTLASALMKMAEGRGVSKEPPLAPGVAAPAP